MNDNRIHGLWWIPEGHHSFSNEKIQGTLSTDNNYRPELEVYIYPKTHGSISRAYENYDVIWGIDIFGNKYTLFNCINTHIQNFRIYKYIPQFTLKGMHLNSFSDKCYNVCRVKYKYLRNWVNPSQLSIKTDNDNTIITIDKSNREPIIQTKIENSIKLSLNWIINCQDAKYNISAEQDVYLSIESIDYLSIQKFIDLTTKFSQFLSLALYKQQYPQEIELIDTDNHGKKSNLKFEIKESKNPSFYSLINFKAMRNQLPDKIQEWFKNYDQLFHISKYLIKSINDSSTFDAPDFLIITQALDGYFKRFVNKKNGKDIRKYQDQIDKLLYHFRDIEAIKKCNINSKVLTHSRNKFTHLIPDDDEKVKQAVEGYELYCLTQKCIILLTCCILESCGFSLKEINDCCNMNSVNYMLNSIRL